MLFARRQVYISTVFNTSKILNLLIYQAYNAEKAFYVCYPFLIRSKRRNMLKKPRELSQPFFNMKIILSKLQSCIFDYILSSHKVRPGNI